MSLAGAITPAAGSARALYQRIGPVSQLGAAELLAVGALEVLAVVEEVTRQLATQELMPLVCNAFVRQLDPKIANLT